MYNSANFFCNVPVIDDGKLTERSFVPIPGDDSLAGAYVELRADMRTLAVISNCPQMNNPCNDGQPTPIRVAILAPE